MAKKKMKNFKVIYGLVVAIFIIATALFGEKINSNETFAYGESVVVRYLDVGQADSILVQSEGINMLIDAGTNSSGQTVVKDLEDLGVTKIDYLIGTHPHEDHIGGMDDIIKNFNIENFYMPDAITTTRTFEDVLDALNEKNITLQTPKIGEMFNIDGVSLECLYVGSDESDLNNTSIVLRLMYGEVSFLFMGDATKIVEDKLLNKVIQSDILKVGHHGSQYSSKETFIKEVSPTYAVISVGKNNTYKHPAELTIKTLNKYGAKVLRTDELGTIIFSSDGKRISYKTEETNTNG